MPNIKRIPWKILPEWLKDNRLHILMYHSISENPIDPHATDPKEFLRHMQYLQKKQVISLSDALKVLKDGTSLKDRYVITFDDGLLDFYSTALPILKDFRYPATMFLPTEFIGKKAEWDSYDTTKPLMNWDQVIECQRWNISFGSHTVQHMSLPNLTKEEVIKELTLSFQTLQACLTNFIPALAYPGGDYNESIASYTRQASYICGLGAASRWGNGPETDFFHLRREKFKR